MAKDAKVDEYNEALEAHMEDGDIVQFQRFVTNGEAHLSGIILDMSDDFLLVQVEDNFRLDGYAIIRKDHYDFLLWSEAEQKLEEIMYNEGELDDLGIDESINMSSWKSIFADLQDHDYHVIVECEDLEDPLFMIGPIEKAKKKSVEITYYDHVGVLESTPSKVKYKDITLVRFGDRYTTMFGKYLEECE